MTRHDHHTQAALHRGMAPHAPPRAMDGAGPQEGAHLLLSTGQGPKECSLGLALAQVPLEASAAMAGLDLSWNPNEDPTAPRSVLVGLDGPGAVRFARALEGAWLWRSPSPLRPHHGRGNWYVSATLLPSSPAAGGIEEAKVRFATMRAGGPGGQHQNTTDSAVRAAWTCPQTGKVYTALARDGRSQHRNKALALERLRAVVGMQHALDGAAFAERLHAIRAHRPAGEAVLVLKGPTGQVITWPEGCPIP